MILKLISEDQAAELNDSILVSIGGHDEESISAGVISIAEGDSDFDDGPMSVPDALTVAQKLADKRGQDTVYISIQSDTVEWNDAWGKLS